MQFEATTMDFAKSFVVGNKQYLLYETSDLNWLVSIFISKCRPPLHRFVNHKSMFGVPSQLVEVFRNSEDFFCVGQAPTTTLQKNISVENLWNAKLQIKSSCMLYLMCKKCNKILTVGSGISKSYCQNNFITQSIG